MKRLKEIKIQEVESLSEFQEHIGTLLNDMDTFITYIDVSNFRKFQKCYNYLDFLWGEIEEYINKIMSADDRHREI